MRRVGTVTWLPENVTQPAYEEQTLLVHAMTLDREHAQACGGHAECATCRVRILRGPVTPMDVEERELLAEHPALVGPGERLACQARPLGDVLVALLEPDLPDFRDL